MALTGAAGLGLALGGAGVAAATSGTPSPGTPTAPNGTATAPGHPHHRGAPEAGGMAGRALHGEFVVRDGKGGYRTVDVQRGTVTAVSSTSLTVKSLDGTSITYVVSPGTTVNAARDGIANVKTGHQVAVVATKSGSTLTATQVRDITVAQQERSAMRSGGAPVTPSSLSGAAGVVGA